MNKKTNQLSTTFSLTLASAMMGVFIGLLYLSFEWIVNNGSNWLWNDVIDSDVYRWRVIPLAVVMSIMLSAIIVISKRVRLSKPSLSLLDELSEVKKISINAIAMIIVIGALSLIAGASLGPEASLVAASMGFAAWLSEKLHILHKPFAYIFTISSIGALLVAFFNSLLPVVIPLLFLKKKGELDIKTILIPISSGITAWGIVRFIKDEAYIELPVSGSLSVSNVALAALLGFLGVAITYAIKWAISISYPPLDRLNSRLHWSISAAVFGLILGLLYFIGGQSVQFSGSEGIKLLSQNPMQYSALALLGLVLVKLLATLWSSISGYRGGLVFPSIYMGVVLSLAIGTLFSLSTPDEAGAMIGAVTGILMGMINPIVGIVLALTLFPVKLLIVLAGGALGSLIAIKFFTSIAPKISSRSRN